MEARLSGHYDPVKAFEELPEGIRAELIDGAIVAMGSPSQAHSAACVSLIGQLYGSDARVQLHALSGCVIDLAAVFDEVQSNDEAQHI